MPPYGAEREAQHHQTEAVITCIMRCPLTLSWITSLQLGRISWCSVERGGRGTGSVLLVRDGVWKGFVCPTKKEPTGPKICGFSLYKCTHWKKESPKTLLQDENGGKRQIMTCPWNWVKCSTSASAAYFCLTPGLTHWLVLKTIWAFWLKVMTINVLILSKSWEFTVSFLVYTSLGENKIILSFILSKQEKAVISHLLLITVHFTVQPHWGEKDFEVYSIEWELITNEIHLWEVSYN